MQNKKTVGIKNANALFLLWPIVLVWACSSSNNDVARVALLVNKPDVSSRPQPVLNAVNAGYQALQTAAQQQTGTFLGQAYGQFGMLLQANDFLEDAHKTYLVASELDPKNFQWPYLVGYLIAEKEDWQGALPWFEKSMKLEPRYAATHVRKGRVLLQLNRLEEAETQFNWVLRVNPKSAVAHFGLGKIATERKEFALAASLLEKAKERQPQATALHYPLAMVYRQLGDREKAKAYLAKRGKDDTSFFDPIVADLQALNASPDEAIRLGLAALEAQRFEKAEELLAKAIRLDPENAAAQLNYGFLKLKRQKLDLAKQHFQRALAINPELVEAQMNLGVVFAIQGDDPGAVKLFQKAQQLDAQFEGAKVLLGNAFMRMNQFESALAMHREVKKLNPTDSRAFFYEVLTLALLERDKEALEAVEQNLASFPNQAELLEAKARLLACAIDSGLRNPDQATAIAKALFEGRQNLSHAETYAMALASQGRFQQAAALQKQVVEKWGEQQVQLKLAAQKRLEDYRQGLFKQRPWNPNHPLVRPGPP